MVSSPNNGVRRMARLVVLSESPRQYIVLVLFGFLLVVIEATIVVPVILSVTSGTAILIILLFLLSLLPLLIGLWLYHRAKSINRMMEMFRNILSTTSDKIVFRDRLSISKCTVESIGYWVSTGRSRSYHYNTDFTDCTSSYTVDSIDLSSFRDGYTLVVHNDGSGYVRIPCIRIDDPLYEGLVLLVLNKTPYRMENRRIVVKTEHDVGEADVAVEDGVLRATLYRIVSGKARRLKLEIEASVSRGGRKYKLRKLVGYVEQGSKTIEYPLTTQEPIVIIAHKKRLSPLLIKKYLSPKTPLLEGFSHGDYKLRLILDIRFHPDVVEEAPLTLSVSHK